jgi:hypothetical protein
MKRLPWNEAEETLDTLFGGRLKILQKKRGYRFSIMPCFSPILPSRARTTGSLI